MNNLNSLVIAGSITEIIDERTFNFKVDNKVIVTVVVDKPEYKLFNFKKDAECRFAGQIRRNKKYGVYVKAEHCEVREPKEVRI